MVKNKTSNDLVIPDDVAIYTVSEVAKIMKTNKNYVYQLIKAGVLPATQIGSIKIRHDTLAKFLAKAEGYNYNDPYNIIKAS